jgi:hypothetical protein
MLRHKRLATVGEFVLVRVDTGATFVARFRRGTICLKVGTTRLLECPMAGGRRWVVRLSGGSSDKTKAGDTDGDYESIHVCFPLRGAMLKCARNECTAGRVVS